MTSDVIKNVLKNRYIFNSVQADTTVKGLVDGVILDYRVLHE